MEAQVSIPQLACMLVNSLFLKLVVSAETRTRTEAARPWVEILAAENIPVIFDEENGVFVVSSEALALERDIDEADEIGGTPKPAELEVPADSVKVIVKTEAEKTEPAVVPVKPHPGLPEQTD